MQSLLKKVGILDTRSVIACIYYPFFKNLSGYCFFWSRNQHAKCEVER